MVSCYRFLEVEALELKKASPAAMLFPLYILLRYGLNKGYKTDRLFDTFCLIMIRYWENYCFSCIINTLECTSGVACIEQKIGGWL